MRRPSISDELKSGSTGYYLGLASPTSIKLTPNGSTPFIGLNNPKSNQLANDPSAPPDVNPWFGNGGANAKTGETFRGCIFLEWVITFDKKPCAGEWGRNVYTNGVLRSDFRVEKDGSVALLVPPTNDTDNQNAYIQETRFTPMTGLAVYFLVP